MAPELGAETKQMGRLYTCHEQLCMIKMLIL